MKRIMLLILSILLISALSLTCFATEDALTITDITAQPGETVYLTLMLNESVVGNTIGISYSFDAALLQVAPGSCSWAKEGVLQDFSKKGSGVWAGADATDLQGPVCVLAFSVAEDAVFTQTEVSCKLLVKNDSDEIGTYTAVATVKQGCEHNYSSWADNGEIGHVRRCKLWQAPQTASHDWDSGKLSEKPGNPDIKIKTFTCVVCGGTKQQEIAANSPEVTQPVQPPTSSEEETSVPTFPTKPTEPVEGTTPPTVPAIKPTAPVATAPASQSGKEQENSQEATYRDYNADDVESGDHIGHNHNDPLQAGYIINPESAENQGPLILPAGTADNEAIIGEHDHGQANDHDHDTVGNAGGSAGSVAAVIGVLVLAVIGSILYIKKR